MKITRGHSVIPAPDRVAWLLPALLAAWLAGWGCVPEPTCEELGCRPGRICNANGECVPRSTDCTEVGCPKGQTCNPETGSCRPETPPCPAQPCPRGYVCNTARGETEGQGVCELKTDCTDQGCQSPVETCNRQTGSCVAKSCADHSDCPTRGYVCGGDDTCVSGCLLEQGNCPTGRSCQPRAVSDSEIGECRRNCESDQDCPYGQECPADSAICEPEGPCSSDANCRDDEVCRDGTCAAPPCSSNDECPGNQVCDLATGVCLGGDCTEDTFAPNQRPENAASIEFDTFTNLRLCPGRSDWFAVELESAEAVRVRIEHAVDRDLDIAVYNQAGRVVAVDGQAPPRNIESGRFVSSTSFVSQTSQTARIRIFSSRRTRPDSGDATPLPEGAAYDLRVASSRNLACRDDAYEENDTRKRAADLPSNLGANPRVELQICGSDDDWFVLPDVAARARFQARLVEIGPDDEHLRFEVVSEHGAHYELRPDQALQLLRTGRKQSWYIHVYSRTGRSASYGIRYQLDGSYSCPQAGRYSTVNSALSLPPATRTTFQLCPLKSQWEVDWIELTAPQSTATLDVAVTNVNPDALSSLDVTLFEKTAKGVRRVRPAAKVGDDRAIRARVEPFQDLLVYVHQEGRPGPLELPPEYRVEYRYGP